MGTFQDLIATLPEDSNEKGLAFERLCKWLLENDPFYTSRIRKVWLWDEWHGRWGPDAGIDLVAEENDGSLWAIQSKAYAETTSVTKADVDSFLSESNREQFKFRLLIATTDAIGTTARQVIKGQEKQASLLLLNELETKPLDWPETFDDLRPTRPTRAEPRPHQSEALEAIEAALPKKGRGRVIMACGTGKTLIQLWAHERLKSKRTLVLVPSLFLVQQSIREWTAHQRVPFNFLAVCSDSTVVQKMDSYVTDITELGLPVTTDADHIRTFLEGKGKQVVFSTYQSSAQIAAAMEGTNLKFDLIVCDEAHQMAGNLSRDFSTGLDDERIPAKRRLFFTATPRYLTGKSVGKAELKDLEVASMDDEEVFGPEIHRLSFGEAIERELLSDYQVVVVGVNDEEVAELATKGTFVNFSGDLTDARTLSRQIGLAKAMRKYEMRRTITFHSRVAHAKKFVNELPEIIAELPEDEAPKGDFVFDHVSGDMSAGSRRIKLNRLRDIEDDGYAVVANARCLSEGVDIPSIDGVAFIDPRRSPIDIVQAVGRSIRLSANKKIGTIVIPVLIPEEEDADTALNDSAFEPVWSVIRALREHDEELAEELDTFRREKGREGRITSGRKPSKIVMDLPDRTVKTIDTVGTNFMDALVTKIVDHTTATWEENFGRLERYAEENGVSNVPDSYVEDDGYRLGNWDNKQRERGNRGQLSQEQTERLESLPGWIWDVENQRIKDAWNRGIENLRIYVSETGTSRAPKSYIAPDGHQLGSWLITNRSKYKSGKMDEEQIKQLEAFPDWTWGAPLWEMYFKLLEDHVAKTGTALVPPKYVSPDGYKLGGWVSGQVKFSREGRMSEERIKQFEALPDWVWGGFGELKKEDAWNRGIENLRIYVSETGTSRASQSYIAPDGYKLGGWVSERLKEYRKGKLSEEQIKQLEAFPGWVWDPFQSLWDQQIALLEDHVAKTGTALVPQKYVNPDGIEIGGIVASLRGRYRDGKLNEERIKQLEAFPGWVWNKNQELWENKLALIEEYVAKTGTALVPPNYLTPDGFHLRRWVSKQKTNYKKSKLSEKRIKTLEALPGWEWDIS